MSGQLFFGDNLHILREHIQSESVDLIYLDPPFNSNANYNILFKGLGGRNAQAQIEAFDDTWHWGIAAETAYDDVMRSGSQASTMVRALRATLGDNDMMAYLAMMSVRLIELHRVLKPTGSLYLHCDPTASHYLKMILDSIFSPFCYKSEISWKRSSAHNDAKQGRKQYGNIRDIVFFYTKHPREWTWNWQFTPYDKEYIDQFYKFTDEKTGRLYRLGDLTAAKTGGDTRYEWRVKRLSGGEWEADPKNEYLYPKPGWEYEGKLPYGKRIWAYSFDNMSKFSNTGRIVYSSTGMPNYKRYLDEMPGVPLQNCWDDIKPPSAKERLGYPTQKPIALLDRIIETSSNPGDVILDPFCGCGTAVHSAERNKRHWIGIDVTFPAIQVIDDRLRYYVPSARYKIDGIPRTLEDAAALAEIDKFQFQFWAVALVGGHSRYGKGGDQGIDGQFFFKRDSKTDGMGIISVKGGKSVNPGMIRDLRGTIERENAEMGVFISLIPPSLQMESEAASAGFFESSQGRHPRIQIKTIADLLDGKGIDSPLQYTTVTMVEAGRQAARGTQKKQAIPPNELLRQRNLLLPISGTGRKKDQEEFELENTSSQLEKAVVKRARNSQI
ncbi:DNA methyltransferase [Agrobacterium sp. 16-2014-1-2a]